MNLRHKIFFFIAVLAAFFGTSMALFIHVEISERFRNELEKRGISIARHIAQNSVGPILSRNPLALSISAHTQKKAEQDIIYVLFLGAAPGELLAHTYGDKFPVNLLGIQSHKEGPGYEIAYLDTEQGQIYDIRVPVSKGGLGFVRVGISAAPINRHIDEMTDHALLVIFGLFVLTLAMAIPLSFGVTRSLSRLTQAAKNVAEGDLEQRVPEKGTDELAELARAFNGMLYRLDEAREELLTKNLKLQREIKGREQAEQELASQLHFMKTLLDELPLPVFYKNTQGTYLLCNRAYENALGKSRDEIIGKSVKDLFAAQEAAQHLRNDLELINKPGAYQYETTFSSPSGVIQHAAFHKATFKGLQGQIEGIVGTLVDLTSERKLDRLRREFISTTAHEFQTPLTAILGFCELLLTSNPIEKSQKTDYLQVIHERAGFLSRMVNQLLDVERIESGRDLPLTLAPVQPEELTKKILHQRPQRSSQLFELNFPRPCPAAMADSDRLSQAIENLISNAAKYSPHQSTISIGAQLHQKMLCFYVANEGTGLSVEEVNRIFDKFYRAHAGDHAPSGHGLGLYITRAIIEAHGGTISVQSAPDKGTRFEIQLPLYQA